MTVLSNIHLFDGTRFRDETAISFENGIITRLDHSTSGRNMNGWMITPGLVDLHMHGQMGKDVMFDDGVQRIAETEIRYGVTSFCPTCVTDTDDRLRAFLEKVRYGMATSNGARVLGAHLEGPYLNPSLCGAHKRDLLKDPSVEHYRSLVNGFEDCVVRVTLAPERKGAMPLIRYLADRNVLVSIGHSEATADETEDAIRYGAKATTHTFNGMRPLHHRQPGVVGVALTSPELIAEMIADMVHIDPRIVRLLYKAKGPTSCFFCTDSMEAAGMPDGEYRLGPSRVTVWDGVARMGDQLAGSTLTMDRAVRLLVDEASIPLHDALTMGTQTPADLIGRSDLGRLQPGAKADFVLWDETLHVRETYVNGQCCYRGG